MSTADTLDRLLSDLEWLFANSNSVTRDISALIGKIESENESLKESNVNLRKRNDKLVEIVKGLMWCLSNDADARECTLYDSDEPYRCKLERMLGEAGVEVEQ